MQIIDRECLACSSFCECGTEIGKGSLLCMSKRVTNKQTKGEMLQKMYDIEKGAAASGVDILEMLNIKNLAKGRDNMRLISNAKYGEPVESGSIFRAEIGGMTISIHRYQGLEGWFLSCRNLGIETMELKSEGLIQAVKESREILKKTVDKMQENINVFCNSKIEIARY